MLVSSHLEHVVGVELIHLTEHGIELLRVGVGRYKELEACESIERLEDEAIGLEQLHLGGVLHRGELRAWERSFKGRGEDFNEGTRESFKEGR